MNDDNVKSDPGIPEETKAIPEVTKAVELTDDAAASASGGGLRGEMLSNVSKTRSEISMTFARNARA